MSKITDVLDDDEKEIISVKDAARLEQYEKLKNRQARTRRAIHDTYSEKSPTKKRRKLPGKRKWKNKELQYAVLEGKMQKDEYNERKVVTGILESAYKRKEKLQSKKDAAKLDIVKKKFAESVKKTSQRQKHSLY